MCGLDSVVARRWINGMVVSEGRGRERDRGGGGGEEGLYVV